MKRKGTLYAGILLTVLGVLLMVIQLTQGIMPHWLGWRGLWPLLVLYVGFAFWLPLVVWWPQRQAISGLAVPAVIVTANGLLFLFQALTHSWSSWTYLWTMEPIAVSLGLFVLYAIGPKTKTLLVAAEIVGAIGVALLLIFGAVFSPVLRILLPVLLIAAGLVMFLRASRGRAQEEGPRA